MFASLENQGNCVKVKVENDIVQWIWWFCNNTVENTYCIYYFSQMIARKQAIFRQLVPLVLDNN